MVWCSVSNLYAEYRAYELEVFNRLSWLPENSEIVTTTLSPMDYMLTHGGTERIGVITRASWICWGDTSRYKKICPQPPTINPRFQTGDKVQIVLKHHVTDQWVGVIENSFYRPDLRSNVYGVRFSERKNLYTRYYEAHLQKSP